MSHLIPLGGKHGEGQFAIVDAHDVPPLTTNSWMVNEDGYAVRAMRRDPVTRRKTTISMHRQIMGLVTGDPRQVDHRNGVRLDNRRSNLRVCPVGVNQQNVRRGFEGTSAFRGVSWNSASGRWRAAVFANGKNNNIGSFSDELEAARAAQRARLELLPFTVEEVLL